MFIIIISIIIVTIIIIIIIRVATISFSFITIARGGSKGPLPGGGREAAVPATNNYDKLLLLLTQ